jgi:hypothetical protein
MTHHGRPGSVVQFLVISALAFCFLQPATAHADSLVTAASVSIDFVNACSTGQTISSGSTTNSCPYGSSSAARATSVADGSLAAGTVGVSTSVVENCGFGANPACAAYPSELLSTQVTSTISYNFAVSGVSNGTVNVALQAEGTATANSSGGVQALIIIPTTESFSGVPAGGLVIPGEPDTIVLADPTNAFGFGVGFQGGTFDVVTPVNNGIASFSLQLFTQAQCYDNPATTQVSCQANLSYLDPLSITGASVYNASDELVSGATLISDSGFNPNATPTPEPSSLLLLGAGLLGLVVIGARAPRVTA